MLSRKQHSTIWNNRDAVTAYQHDRETKEATARGSFALRTLVFEDRGQSSIVRSPILCSRSSTPSPKKMNGTTDHPGTDANRKEQDGQDNQDKSHEAFSRGFTFLKLCSRYFYVAHPIFWVFSSCYSFSCSCLGVFLRVLRVFSVLAALCLSVSAAL